MCDLLERRRRERDFFASIFGGRIFSLDPDLSLVFFDFVFPSLFEKRGKRQQRSQRAEEKNSEAD